MSYFLRWPSRENHPATPPSGHPPDPCPASGHPFRRFPDSHPVRGSPPHFHLHVLEGHSPGCLLGILGLRDHRPGCLSTSRGIYLKTHAHYPWARPVGGVLFFFLSFFSFYRSFGIQPVIGGGLSEPPGLCPLLIIIDCNCVLIRLILFPAYLVSK